MRFDRLKIPAFGPFTDLHIAFPSAGGDLHVIYGPNEAGKSSLLRAFRDLLFGIHSQSPDNFKHDYKDLRILAEIYNRNGDKLIFQRRKGIKNTLLNGAGDPLADTELTPFLGSVDQGYFSAMFGLGARELREGAEQLLRGQGEIGEALFSASMGGTPVQLVLAALTEESERLFKGRASATVSIRPGVGRYRELLRQSREAAVAPEVWEKVERELAAAEIRRNELESVILEIGRDVEWLTRCEDALPTVGRLSEEMRKLETLSGLPHLSVDFVERARAARKTVDEAQAEMVRLTAQIAKLEAQSAECRFSPDLLAEADALDRLHQELRVYGDRKKSHTQQEMELAGLESALRTGMSKMSMCGDFSELESLRLTSAIRLECEESAAALHQAEKEFERVSDKTEDVCKQIETRESELKEIPETDLSRLRDALASAADATDAAKTLSASEADVFRLNQETRQRHRQLAGAPDDLERTADLPVPAKSTIRRFAEELAGIQRDIQAETSRIREGKKRIESIQAELKRLERRGELPTEASLTIARNHRDQGWRLVLAAWKGAGDVEEFVPGKPLEEAFPEAVIHADQIADRLREEAEAVAQAEEKRFQISQWEKQNRESEESIHVLDEKRLAVQSEWESLWQPCGIVPRTPSEMDEWRDAWQEFKGQVHQLRAAEETLTRKKELILQAEKLLAAVLAEPEEKGFAWLYSKGVRQVQKQEQLSGRRLAIVEQIQKLKNQAETLHRNSRRSGQACEAAKEKWISRCRSIGLPADISPSSGLALLRERADILTEFDAWKKTSAAMLKTREAIRQYDARAEAYRKRLGIEGDTTEACVSRLWESLSRAREVRTRYDHLAIQIDEANSDRVDRQAAHAQAVDALAFLTRQAGVDSPDALAPLLADLEAREHILSQIAGLRDTLSGLARGQSVDDFLARIRSEDVETLAQRKAVLMRRKSDAETSLQAVRDELSHLNGRKQFLESAGDAAADFRQQAELVATRVRQDAARFVRLRLAVHFLQTQIERFRKENQGPLLEKSGHIYRNITRGAFTGLGAEFSSDDIPILVGVRPDQSKVPVSGMSDGSRDQLYLALRLAALDRYLASHEPMPLILDDLLITFDDERAMAILPQLAELARRTQIFLFTHHDHLVELCRRALSQDDFHLHRLGSG